VRKPSRDTLIAYAIGAAIAVPMLLPVLDNIEDGRRLLETGILTARERLHPMGLGPVSGLMVYVLAAPIVIVLGRSLGAKLALILGLVTLSLAISQITTNLEKDRIVLGLSQAWLTLAAVVVIGRLAWYRNSQRRKAMEQRANALAELVRTVVAHSQASAIEPLTREQTGNRQDSALVEKMALGVIWQSAVEGPPQTFNQRVVKGLAGMRRDMIGNVAIDPSGFGLALIDQIVEKVRLHLNMEDRNRRQERVSESGPTCATTDQLD